MARSVYFTISRPQRRLLSLRGATFDAANTTITFTTAKLKRTISDWKTRRLLTQRSQVSLS